MKRLGTGWYRSPKGRFTLARSMDYPDRWELTDHLGDMDELSATIDIASSKRELLEHWGQFIADNDQREIEG